MEEGRGSGTQALFADILCAVDGSNASLEAVRQAVALAGPDGRLTLLVVTAARDAARLTTRTAAVCSSRAIDVLMLAERIAHNAGVPASRILDPPGPPAEVVLERSSEHDLLAMGAPVSSWLGALLVGGVADEALRSSTAPLLMARKPPASVPFPERIVVASDGLEDSDELVEVGARLAQAHRAGVILVHDIGAAPRPRPRQIEAQARALERALPEGSEVHVEAMSPAEAIVARANGAGASLIVMGSRRRDGSRALGSVSVRVVREASCSVLLIPPSAA